MTLAGALLFSESTIQPFLEVDVLSADNVIHSIGEAVKPILYQ
jgi:hypothetical protein